MRYRQLIIGAVLLCALGWVRLAQAIDLAIVSSERSPNYIEAIDASVAELARTGPENVRILHFLASEFAGAEPAALERTKLVVALGTEALKQVLARDLRVPVIAALIPRSGFERVIREHGGKPGATVTALYLDQPFGRQLDLIRLVDSNAKRVGLLWGPESAAQRPLLLSALQSRGLQEVNGQVLEAGSLFAGLKIALEDADVLLAVADPQVFNSATIANILLATYRARIPVLAFSPAYLKAGAALSLYSSPAKIGTQVAVMARQSLSGGSPPRHQYPVDFIVGVNEHVARSLGLTLDAATLSDRLHALERER